MGAICLIIIFVLLMAGWSNEPEKSLLTDGGMCLPGMIFVLLSICMPKLFSPDYRIVEETITDIELT
jgi:hypothetical protein